MTSCVGYAVRRAVLCVAKHRVKRSVTVGRRRRLAQAGQVARGAELAGLRRCAAHSEAQLARRLLQRAQLRAACNKPGDKHDACEWAATGGLVSSCRCSAAQGVATPSKTLGPPSRPPAQPSAVAVPHKSASCVRCDSAAVRSASGQHPRAAKTPKQPKPAAHSATARRMQRRRPRAIPTAAASTAAAACWKGSGCRRISSGRVSSSVSPRGEQNCCLGSKGPSPSMLHAALWPAASPGPVPSLDSPPPLHAVLAKRSVASTPRWSE